MSRKGGGGGRGMLILLNLREFWIIHRGPGFLAVVCFGPSPTPSPLSRQEVRPAKHRRTEKERQLADGRGGRRGVRRSKIKKTSEKVWYSIKRSRLSALYDVNIPGYYRAKYPPLPPAHILNVMTRRVQLRMRCTQAALSSPAFLPAHQQFVRACIVWRRCIIVIYQHSAPGCNCAFTRPYKFIFAQLFRVSGLFSIFFKKNGKLTLHKEVVFF